MTPAEHEALYRVRKSIAAAISRAATSGVAVEVCLGCGQVSLSDHPCDVCRQARKDRQ